MLDVPKFQEFVEAATAALARVIPVVAPSRFEAAASAPASQNACVSFLAMKMRPISTAKPTTAKTAVADKAMMTSTTPRLRVDLAARALLQAMVDALMSIPP